MASDEFEKNVLSKLTPDSGTDPHGIALVLLQALKLADQDKLTDVVVDDLETSAYRLAGITQTGTALARAFAAWERDKWHKVLSAAALG